MFSTRVGFVQGVVWRLADGHCARRTMGPQQSGQAKTGTGLQCARAPAGICVGGSDKKPGAARLIAAAVTPGLPRRLHDLSAALQPHYFFHSHLKISLPPAALPRNHGPTRTHSLPSEAPLFSGSLTAAHLHFPPARNWRFAKTNQIVEISHVGQPLACGLWPGASAFCAVERRACLAWSPVSGVYSWVLAPTAAHRTAGPKTHLR